MDSDNTCPWADYQPGTKYDIDVTNSEFHTDKVEREYANGHAMVNSDLEGTLSVAFGPIRPKSNGDNYVILDTDNDGFSYVWSCSDVCVFKKCLHRPVLWVLNRSHELSRNSGVKEIRKALAILENKFGYDAEILRSKIKLSSHENCDY